MKEFSYSDPLDQLISNVSPFFLLIWSNICNAKGDLISKSFFTLDDFFLLMDRARDLSPLFGDMSQPFWLKATFSFSQKGTYLDFHTNSALVSWVSEATPSVTPFSKRLIKLAIFLDCKFPGLLCLALPARRKVQKLDFQSEFLSKIIRIFLNFFFHWRIIG